VHSDLKTVKLCVRVSCQSWQKGGRTMELRVWTDGIERVVCGVSDVTTCRDVIVALARTVGKTGRYWLVETCHGRQRRLPAAERILARSVSVTRFI